MRKGLKEIILCTPLLCLIWIASCTDDAESRGKGLVNILLVDAPVSFDQVWIEILGVEILPEGSRGENNADWVSIPYTPVNKKVLVSNLVAEERLLLGRKEIPTGNISQIKLKLGNDHTLFRGNSEFLLKLNGNSGDVILDVNYSIANGISYDLFIDFDLGRSIKELPQENSFLLEPTIRSFSRTNTGELGGRILPAAAKPVIYAISGLDSISTRTNNAGNFLFWGLSAGNYRIFIQPMATFMDSTLWTTVSLGQITEIEPINLRSRIVVEEEVEEEIEED